MDDSEKRVAQKFLLPLDMNEKARTALKEYWHYSYLRACLYREGYSFLGKPLPHAFLSLQGEGELYTNTLAGISATLPKDSAILEDNVLNVDEDYRALQSTLLFGSTSVALTTYVSHEDIHTFEDLEQHTALLLPEGVPFVSQEKSVNANGVSFVRIEDNTARCGIAFLTPEARVLFLTTPCVQKTILDTFMQTLSFVPSVSVY